MARKPVGKNVPSWGLWSVSDRNAQASYNVRESAVALLPQANTGMPSDHEPKQRYAV